MGDLEGLKELTRRLKARPDPLRDGLKHGEAAPVTYTSLGLGETLEMLRRRFRLTRADMAARAGLCARVVGRIEKGADMRLSTLRKLYAAVGCRPVILPAGVLDELDWVEAHEDDQSFDVDRELERLHRLTPEEMDAEIDRELAEDGMPPEERAEVIRRARRNRERL